MNEQLSGLRPAQRDILRLAGSVVFAAGAVVLAIRKSDDWADFPMLLVFLVPCLLLYGLGIGRVRIGPGDDGDDRAAGGDGLPAWRATAAVLGILLVPLALSQLVETIGGDSGKSFHVFWVFLATAGAAGYAAYVHGLRYGALLAGLALIVSWIGLWDAILDPSATTIRWLFLVAGVVLTLAALRLHKEGRREAPELVTAAGVAGLAAGVTGLFGIASQAIAGAFASALGGGTDLSGVQQRQEWDLFLLALALVLIWYGARTAARGPVYVGGFALFTFVVSVGTEVAGLFKGDEPSGDVIGWPLLLLLVGGGALAAGLMGGGGSRSGGGVPAEPRPDTPAPATTAPPPQL
jgi:hypothetical protein